MYNYLKKSKYETFAQMRIRQREEKETNRYLLFMVVAVWAVFLIINFN
jgi:hypothetical protein